MIDKIKDHCKNIKKLALEIGLITILIVIVFILVVPTGDFSDFLTIALITLIGWKWYIAICIVLILAIIFIHSRNRKVKELFMESPLGKCFGFSKNYYYSLKERKF